MTATAVWSARHSPIRCAKNMPVTSLSRTRSQCCSSHATSARVPAESSSALRWCLLFCPRLDDRLEDGASSVDPGQDVMGGGGPDDGLGVVVVDVEVCLDGGDQVRVRTGTLCCNGLGRGCPTARQRLALRVEGVNAAIRNVRRSHL